MFETLTAAVIAILIALFIFGLWVFCKLGSDLSREEEARLWANRNENTCVCCGEVIPEGTQVCHKCNREIK